VLEWFLSYLEQRSQSVSVHGILSDIQFLLSGVPQGSVLGRRVFTVYTRSFEITAQRYGVKYRLYADDILSEIEYNPGASCRPTVDPPSGEWFYLARRRDVVTALTTVNNLLEMSDTLSYQAIRSANVAREAVRYML
jgi:hypothetical protein